MLPTHCRERSLIRACHQLVAFELVSARELERALEQRARFVEAPEQDVDGGAVAEQQQPRRRARGLLRDTHPARVVFARQAQLSLAVVGRPDVEQVERELGVEARAFDVLERAQVSFGRGFALGVVLEPDGDIGVGASAQHRRDLVSLEHREELLQLIDGLDVTTQCARPMFDDREVRDITRELGAPEITAGSTQDAELAQAMFSVRDGAFVVSR